MEAPSLRDRRSGVLLHLTSLPGPYGSGDLGEEAVRFVDFLAAAGQSWWQMLPVGPPGEGFCPYMATSAFALGRHLVDLDELRRRGLLEASDLRTNPTPAEGPVVVGSVMPFRETALRLASERFFSRARPAERESYEAFRRKEAGWLDDYCLFSALKDAGGRAPWTDWDPGVRDRDPAALASARTDLDPEIRHYGFVQYTAARQWERLRDACRRSGIGLIGDLPIFVAHDSADVWANREVFFLDEEGRSTVVAGVPPDYFSENGQRWGHPLYNWPLLRERGYDWWVARFRRTLATFDAVRLDHFIGFQRYWEIPASSPTAVDGHWKPGPGDDFFRRILSEFGGTPIIAEDLGAVDADVVALRDRFDLPGMRVLQFAFNGDPYNDHLPHRHTFRSVVYTGTHDNDTTAGWFGALTARAARTDPGDQEEAAAARREREFVLRYLGTNGREIHWEMIRLALSSVADLAVIPAQDLLGLGSEARMNLPSEAEGNWTWRLAPGAIDDTVARRLRTLAETFGRIPPRPSAGAFTDGEPRA